MTIWSVIGIFVLTVCGAAGGRLYLKSLQAAISNNEAFAAKHMDRELENQKLRALLERARESVEFVQYLELKSRSTPAAQLIKEIDEALGK